MSEIKSTLDLVMEKTKHLSMSKEEKAAQQRDEIKKILKGLILKFRDDILSQKRFTEELKILERAHDVDIRSELVKEILNEIDLGKDNIPLIVLLREICGMDTGLLDSILAQYSESTASAKDKRVSEMTEHLYKTRRISGTAVVPNLENDVEWNQERQSIKEAYRAQLEQVRTEMLNR